MEGRFVHTHSGGPVSQVLCNLELTMTKIIFVLLLKNLMSKNRKNSSKMVKGIVKSVSKRIHPRGDLVS